MLTLFLLHLQRLALIATIDGQMDVLSFPLDREYRVKVMLAHARTEAALLMVDAMIRKLQRGHGLQAIGA